jgi:hypothetical protein
MLSITSLVCSRESSVVSEQHMTGTTWEPSLTAVEELGVMLQNVEFGKPLHGMQAQNIYECTSFVRAGLVDNPFQDPIADELALVSVCDAVLDWLIQAQDQDRVNRVQKALSAYRRLCDELDK